MVLEMKDKIKMCIALSALILIIIGVLIVVLKYNIEGEKNMPYKLSKITIISTASGESEETSTTENTQWNLNVCQNNAVYFFIDKNTQTNEVIESVTIENIVVTKQPTKGTIKTFMPSSLDKSTFTYSNDFIVEDKLEYKGGTTSNPKTLEIANQGGSVLIGFSNTNIGSFTLDENVEVKHDGTLLTKVGATQEEVEFEVSCDLTIQVNKIKYKTNIKLNLPYDKICEEGRTTKEITDTSGFIFKRVK